MAGGVLSIDKEVVPVAQLPAGSQLGALTYATSEPSVEATVSGGSLGVPDEGSSSTARQSMTTSALYQPLAFGNGMVALTTGAFVSPKIASVGSPMLAASLTRN